MDEDDPYKFIEKAIIKSWDFWLSQHSISIEDCIEVAVNQAMTSWLDAHKEEVFNKIAQLVVKKIQDSPET